MILQYFSHEDPANPGLYASWACLIQYDMTTGLTYATKEDVTVKNYYGSNQMTVQDTPHLSYISTFNAPDATAFSMWGAESANEST